MSTPSGVSAAVQRRLRAASELAHSMSQSVPPWAADLGRCDTLRDAGPPVSSDTVRRRISRQRVNSLLRRRKNLRFDC